MSSKLFIVSTISLGVFVDTLAYSIVLPFFPILVASLNGTSSEVGMILAFFSLGMILGSIAFGYFSDVLKRRKELMILGLTCLILSTTLMAIYRTLWSLCIGRFVQGLASGSVWVLGLSLVSDICVESELGLTMSNLFLGYTLGGLVGPLIGGLLYEVATWLPYVVVIGLAFIDLVMRLLIVEPKQRVSGQSRISDLEAPKPESSDLELELVHSQVYVLNTVPDSTDDLVSTRRTSLQILTALRQNTALWLVLGLTIICGIMTGSLEVVFTLQLENHYNLSAATTGICFLALIIPQAITSPIGGYCYDKKGYRATALPGLIASSIPFFLLTIPMPLYLFLILIGILSGITMFSLSPILPEIAKVVAADSIGLAYGLFNGAFAIGLLIGPILGGILYQYAGFLAYCVAIGCVMILAVPLVWVYHPQDGVVK